MVNLNVLSYNYVLHTIWYKDVINISYEKVSVIYILTLTNKTKKSKTYYVKDLKISRVPDIVIYLRIFIRCFKDKQFVNNCISILYT